MYTIELIAWDPEDNVLVSVTERLHARCLAARLFESLVLTPTKGACAVGMYVDLPSGNKELICWTARDITDTRDMGKDSEKIEWVIGSSSVAQWNPTMSVFNNCSAIGYGWDMCAAPIPPGGRTETVWSVLDKNARITINAPIQG